MTPFLSFNPPVIAHRGASAYAPENTMAAFVKAAQLGVKWIEFDVMESKDGEAVIFHDESLERTTNGRGELTDFPYAHLRSLDAGRWFSPIYSGEPMPTLRQVLAFLVDAKMNANIEIKALPGQEERLVKYVLAEVKRFIPATGPMILFSSFSIKALHCLRKHSSDCLIGLLMHEWLLDWFSISKTIDCVSVHVNEAILTAEYAQEVKSKHLGLLAYTVNNAARAKTLFTWGVDAVFSDMPDRILAI